MRLLRLLDRGARRQPARVDIGKEGLHVEQAFPSAGQREKCSKIIFGFPAHRGRMSSNAPSDCRDAALHSHGLRPRSDIRRARTI